MIRVHVAAEKNISSAMEDKNVGKKLEIMKWKNEKYPDVKQKWRFELVDEV